MLVRIIPLAKRRFGLAVDIRPVPLRVIIDEPCPVHGKTINNIMTLEGREPINGCIDCLIDMMKNLTTVAEEFEITAKSQSA